MPDYTKFLHNTASLASEITPGVLLKFCEQLECSSPAYPSEEAVQSSLQVVNQPAVRNLLLNFLIACREQHPELSAKEIAWALRSASATDEFHRSRRRLELVWTGPAPSNSSLRRTDQVLLYLIQQAHDSLIIVTFAAYKIPRISEALKQATERGVSIQLILESSEESQGKVAFNAIHALGREVAARSRIYYWPLDQREQNEQGRHGSLHVKCAVADTNALFLSSANLTDFAFNLNMEMGLLIRGGKLPIQAHEHFRALIERGVLKKIS